MSLRIIPVESPQDMEDFLQLPFAIYEGDPHWVPPVLPHQRKFLDPRTGPFFEVGTAQYFIAKDGQRTLGRLSAHLNYAYEKHHDTNTGFFGFFECVDDKDTAHALFDTAAGWVRERGKTRLHGPLSFGIYDEVGLLVEGYHQRPVMFHTYNHPYYEQLVESWGFSKTFDWFAYIIDSLPMPIEDIVKRRDELLEAANVKIIKGNTDEFIRRGPEVLELFNTLWDKNWGHVPLTQKQFDDIFMQLRPILRPELVNFIVENDELLAFCIVAPDINYTLHKIRSNLNWWGMLRLFLDCRVLPLKASRAIIMGVKKSHQWRKLHHALILNTMVDLNKYRRVNTHCDCSLIPESLVKWNKTLQMFGGRKWRTFRLYDRAI
uniref:N-acetyltransferase n=1 Tax=Fundidesulfovibrio putealis TaxID=270496 RepID=A0A7C4EMK2_9BACT